MNQNLSKYTEDYIRLRLDNFPQDFFESNINTVSIDFIREVSNYIDIKRTLWTCRPWGTRETIEEHMIKWFPKLEEFWRPMLADEEYNDRYKWNL